MLVTIPCKHETGEACMDERIDDYHPLARDEVRQLLEIGYRAEHYRLRADIQVRLIQAIPGMQCPRLASNSSRINIASACYLNGLAHFRATAVADDNFFDTWTERMCLALKGGLSS